MNIKIRLIAAILVVIYAVLPCSASDKGGNISYIPRFGGVGRIRWEMSTSQGMAGDNRFAVQNARLWVKGNIAEPVQYYLRADLCAQGAVMFLDGWVRFDTAPWLQLQAGQFRTPFGLDSFRGPGTYIFANRSFIGRDLANNRAVGIQASTTLPGTPLSVDFGIFSPHSISDHAKWSRKMTFAAKAVLDLNPVTVTAGYQTIAPDSVRINMANIGATLSLDRFTVEAEYMYKHYTNSAFRACHGYNIWADYSLPVKTSLFNRLSFQARYDGSTPHSTGRRDSYG
ncbi:MAG: porin, partial [Muribaculaceae bacterium]|nr:porin [Muribaculaceae bacterium]